MVKFEFMDKNTDYEEIANFIVENKSHFKNPYWCFTDSFDEAYKVRSIVLKDGVGIAARVDNKLVGIAIITFYRNNTEVYKAKKKRELEKMLGLPKSTKVAAMDIQIVDHTYYGHGLQRQLLCECEEYLKRLGYTAFYATVHPLNKYSENNFLSLGYEVVLTIYGIYGVLYDGDVVLKLI